MTDTSVQRAYWGAGLLYFCVVLLVLFMVPGETAVLHGADAGSWLRPAQGLIEFGAFVDPRDPGIFLTDRPPLYPTFVAVSLFLGGEAFPKLLVTFQATLFLICGIAIARWVGRLVDPSLSWAGPLAFALFLFNPNALGTVFFLQSETLFAALILASAIQLHRTLTTPSLVEGIKTGAWLALAALTRPEGQFLIPIIFLSLPLLSALSGAPNGLHRGSVASVGVLVAAMVLTVPWMARNAELGAGFRVTGAANTVYYLWGSNTQLEMIATGSGGAEAEARMQAAQQKIAASHEDWETLTEGQQQAYLQGGAVDRMLSYPLPVIAKQIVLANLQFFTAGGAGRLFVLAGQPGASPFAVMQASGESDYAMAVWKALKQADLGLLSLWVLAMGYVVVTRILGLIGLYRLLRSGRWELFLPIVGIILFFALVMPFYGISRFRVPIEFCFVLLTCFAFFVPEKRGRV